MERTDVKNNHTEEYSTGQIRCIEKSDPEYPQIMKQYSSMPAKLYVKGRLPDPKRRTVAVIGARMCSPYGRMQAFRYAKALSVAGVQIIRNRAYLVWHVPTRKQSWYLPLDEKQCLVPIPLQWQCRQNLIHSFLTAPQQ